jgi:hypothetical protein
VNSAIREKQKQTQSQAQGFREFKHERDAKEETRLKAK